MRPTSRCPVHHSIPSLWYPLHSSIPYTVAFWLGCNVFMAQVAEANRALEAAAEVSMDAPIDEDDTHFHTDMAPHAWLRLSTCLAEALHMPG